MLSFGEESESAERSTSLSERAGQLECKLLGVNVSEPDAEAFTCCDICTSGLSVREDCSSGFDVDDLVSLSLT